MIRRCDGVVVLWARFKRATSVSWGRRRQIQGRSHALNSQAIVGCEMESALPLCIA